MRSLILVSIVFLGAGCSVKASANDSEWLQRAISSARSGAVIDIPAGDYDLTDQKIARSVTLRGSTDGKTVFRSAAVTDKGVLVPQAGVDLTVENITFEGVRAWDKNGSGIRHEGRNLTVANCKFLNSDEGILATGAESGTITVRNSEFRDNGFGDGQSHGIYVSSGAKLVVDGSKFIGTRIGHHIKSLAAVTVVRNSLMDDGLGKSSYAVDVSKGGDVTIENNRIVQAYDGENYTIINYDLSRGGEAVNLVISGNEIINHFDGGVLLRNDTRLAPVLSENRIENTGDKALALTSQGSPAPRRQ